MMQKIKCWFGIHEPIMTTRENPFYIYPDRIIEQTVLCKHCRKVFIFVDWSKKK